MKKVFVLILASMFCTPSFPQAKNEMAEADSTLSADMEKVMSACISLSKAAATEDKEALKSVSASLKDCQTAAFGSLRCKDDSLTSVKGHLVFDEVFADSLIAGVNAYEIADICIGIQAVRGQTSDGHILTKTCMVKAGQTTKYSFMANGHQELAVVVEAGGLVTMKIGVTNRAGLNKRFDDTKDVKQGRNFRKAVFEMPKDKSNTVTLEVVNCSGKDISFVVISN